MTWIKTTDRLPDVGQRVICYMPDALYKEDRLTVMTLVNFVEDEESISGQRTHFETLLFEDVNGNDYAKEDVKYWCCLPDLPEE